jgi:plastocyanin
MLDFTYLPGEFSLGIPTVSLGEPLTFLNQDAALDIWHTVTSCAYPCNGDTGIAFPLADGVSDQGTLVDFDSGELGIGIPGLTAVKNEIRWDLPITADDGFRSGERYTYFCRIHPSMRGVFAVE